MSTVSIHSKRLSQLLKWIFVVIVISFSLIHLPIIKGERENKAPLFVATEEWQEVPPGYNIPPGLRVRLNLQTGSREARLMRPEDKLENDKASLESDKSDHILPNDVPPHSLTLKTVNTSNVTSRFRSYEELKAEFQAINAKLKTDFELINDIVRELRKESVEESRLLTLLEELDYLLHQIDNGKQFSEDGGLTLLGELLQNSSLRVQQAVLSAISAAVQGNTAAKVIALQNELLDTVHSLLKRMSLLPFVREDELKVIHRGVGTLGAMLRDFPVAQGYFFGHQTLTDSLSPPGFTLLSDLFDRTLSRNPTELSVNIRVRILTLFSDLARERSSAKQRSENPADTFGQKLWPFYSSFPFESALIEAGWCTRLRNAFHSDMNFPGDQGVSPTNHDRREKLLNCMLHLYPICEHTLLLQTDVDDSSVVDKLEQLEEEYVAVLSNPSKQSDTLEPESARSSTSTTLAEDEGDLEGFEDLANEILHLIHHLLDLQKNMTRHKIVHDPAEL